MVVVAEGVEDASQARFLEEAGADLLQGYLCSPPLDAEAFEGLLRDGGGAERALCLERGRTEPT